MQPRHNRGRRRSHACEPAHLRALRCWGALKPVSHRVRECPAPMPPACAQATLQAMTDPNAAGGANVFLGALVSGTAALNGARARTRHGIAQVALCEASV